MRGGIEQCALAKFANAVVHFGLIVHLESQIDAGDFTALPMPPESFPECCGIVAGAFQVVYEDIFRKGTIEMAQRSKILRRIAQHGILPIQDSGQAAICRINKKILLPEIAMNQPRLLWQWWRRRMPGFNAPELIM